MPRVTRAFPHLSLDEVREKMQTAPRFWLYQKWAVIYTALADPRPAAHIARQLGVSLSFVHVVVATYNRLGPQALDTPGTGGRRHNHMTEAEERAFLAPFFERAAAGELTTVRAIHAAFETKVGKKVHHSVIYRLLDRHEWRRVMPRPRHPEDTTEAQETFKKTSRLRSRRSMKHERPMIPAPRS